MFFYSMQILLFLLISFIASFFGICLLRFWLRELFSFRTAALFSACMIPLNAAGVILFDCIYQAGAPALTCFTQAPGRVTLLFFLAGISLTESLVCLLILLFQKKIHGAKIRADCPSYLSQIVLISFFCAVCLELFLFNYRHYELIGIDSKNIGYERGSIVPSGFYFNRASQSFQKWNLPSNLRYGFTLYLNNQKIRNIQLNMDTGEQKTEIEIIYSDEAFRYAVSIPTHELIASVPRSFNIPLHTRGKTPEIRINFLKSDFKEIKFDSFVVNQPVKLNFSMLRFMIVFVLFTIIGCLSPGSPLYQIKLNFSSISQQTLLWLLPLACTGILIWVSADNYSGSNQSISDQKINLNRNFMLYNDLVDALQAHRFSLLEDPNEKLINLHNPYDITERRYENASYIWDASLYHGKYYVYFGIVPVVILLLPWKILTHFHLELDYAILLFCGIGLAGLYLLYRKLVQSFFSDIPLLLYTEGFFLIFFSVNLSWCVRRALAYELAITSGFCFAVWAVYLMWKACTGDSMHSLSLFGSGLAAALAVGCRPSLILISIPVIAVFFTALKERYRLLSRESLGKTAAFFIPYFLIGTLLMKYNDARFGNIAEFGTSYQLTTANPSGSFFRTGFSGILLSMLSYFFTPPDLNLSFPFIHIRTVSFLYNGFLDYGQMMGIFFCPIFWFIFYSGKSLTYPTREDHQLQVLIRSFIISALLLIFCCSCFSISFRYMTDFSWLFILPAVLRFFKVCQTAAQNRMEKGIYSAGLFCFLSGLLLFAAVSLSGEDDWLSMINPALFDRLSSLWEFWL